MAALPLLARAERQPAGAGCHCEWSEAVLGGGKQLQEVLPPWGPPSQWGGPAVTRSAVAGTGRREESGNAVLRPHVPSCPPSPARASDAFSPFPTAEATFKGGSNPSRFSLTCPLGAFVPPPKPRGAPAANAPTGPPAPWFSEHQQHQRLGVPALHAAREPPRTSGLCPTEQPASRQEPALWFQKHIVPW